MERDGTREPESDLSLREVFRWSQYGRSWTSDHWGVVLGFGSAIAAGVLGMCLPISGWVGLGGDHARILEVTGALLLLATIPLALAGAHCLDRLEVSLTSAVIAKPPAEDATAGDTRPAAGSGPLLAPPRYVFLSERVPPEPRRRSGPG